MKKKQEEEEEGSCDKHRGTKITVLKAPRLSLFVLLITVTWQQRAVGSDDGNVTRSGLFQHAAL